MKKEDLELYGNWNTEKARTIQVVLRRCEGEAYCKTDEEIDDFLRGNFLLLLNNGIRFDSTKYG